VATAAAVAAWLAYVRGKDAAGTVWAVDDPFAARLAACHRGGPTDAVGALLALKDIFPPRLAEHFRFRHDVLAAYTALLVPRNRA
jgi:fructuronate reductase